MDWRLLKSWGGMKAKLTQGDYAPYIQFQLNVEGCIRLVNSGGGARPCLFLLVVVHIWMERVLPTERAWNSLSANNCGLNGMNEWGWRVPSGSQFPSFGKNDHFPYLPCKSNEPSCRNKLTTPPGREVSLGSQALVESRGKGWSLVGGISPLPRVLCVCPCVCACADGSYSVWLAIYFVLKAPGCLGLYLFIPLCTEACKWDC